MSKDRHHGIEESLERNGGDRQVLYVTGRMKVQIQDAGGGGGGGVLGGGGGVTMPRAYHYACPRYSADVLEISVRVEQGVHRLDPLMLHGVVGNG